MEEKTIQITSEELLLIRAAIGSWCTSLKESNAFDFELQALETLKAKGVILNYKFKK